MLTERQQQIVQAIVHEYIRRPVPVSSETVAQRMTAAVSSATIRNDIAELEEGGYVTRPHASAGGIPSDKAYRFYVESLEEVEEVPVGVRNQVRRRFRMVDLDVDVWSRLAVELLAGMVHNMAMATSPRAATARWKHVELVYLREFLALLVMVLTESRLKKQLVPLKEHMSQDDLSRVANTLNARFEGLSPQEAALRTAELTPIEAQVSDLAISLLRSDEEKATPVHYVDGLRHLFGYPELAAGPKAKALAELLEDPEVIPSVLAEAPSTGDVEVTIGTENRYDLLYPFSLVFARYGLAPGATGVVAIVGPTRMAYGAAISHVRYFSSLMTEMVGGLEDRAT